MSTFYVANDHAGLQLKAEVAQYLSSAGHTVIDLGTNSPASTDYPDYAKALADRVAAEPGAFGVLVCGTGQGMAMAANRVHGVRAAVCSDTFSARATRQHNNANVLCLGQRVVGVGLALDIVNVFATTAFEGGRHAARIAKFDPS